ASSAGRSPSAPSTSGPGRSSSRRTKPSPGPAASRLERLALWVLAAHAPPSPGGMQQSVVGPLPVSEPVGEPGFAGQLPPVGVVTLILTLVIRLGKLCATHAPEVTVASSVWQLGGSVESL